MPTTLFSIWFVGLPFAFVLYLVLAIVDGIKDPTYDTTDAILDLLQVAFFTIIWPFVVPLTVLVLLVRGIRGIIQRKSL